MVKNEIKVFARLKPESSGRKNTVNYQIYRRPKKTIEEDYLVLNGEEKSSNDYINNRPESWNFAFHQIFDRDINQDEIFQKVAKPIVQSVLNGYNGTIFAYGQTGSGKTYSITGDKERYEDRGVIPRTVQYLFETIQKNPDNIYSVEIAYLEIYNENGYDLLDPKHDVVTKLEDLPRVTIQEDENGKLHLKNLSFRTVDNEKDALALLFLGDTNRAISETPMNPQSSRSHCIFTIAVTVKEFGSENLSKAKIHLVDLAGSERVYKCCISGNILTEAKYINLSLHYLEQVIVCLGQPNVSHIPYRNSLLTAILRDSLGGNCLTTMLATLSLNRSNFEETISTCRFSQRVALIKNDVDLVLARDTEDENKFLKIEIERLRKQISQLTEKPQHSNEELTAKEKNDLENQINNYLRSDVAIDCLRNDKKVEYCLKILRDKLNSTVNGKFFRSIEEPEKDINYYRDLVIQRDREISALVEMLKKTVTNSSSTLKKSSNDQEFLEKNKIDHRNETEGSTISSTIAKKVRLKNLMAEARSIAELIKNGKASIGDFKKRMSEPSLLSPIEAQTVYHNLENEQSKLANNLNRLKTLKSEATELKKALSLYSQELIFTTDGNEVVKEDSKNSFENFNSERRSVRSSNGSRITSKLTESTVNANRFEELMSKVSSSNYGSVEGDLSSKCFSTNQVKNECKEFGTNIAVRNNDDRDEKSITDLDCSLNSKNVFITEKDVKKCENTIGGGGDSRRNLSERKTFLVDEKSEIFQNAVKSSMTFDSPKSEKADVKSDQLISITSANISDIPEVNITDIEYHLKSSGCSTSSRCNFTSSESQISEKNLNNEKELSSSSPEFGNDHRLLQQAHIIDEEEDSFIKSLPLTGDPEIDEEIIAFYRAKRSGGNY